MFINTTTHQYPLTALQVINANPDKSFPVPFELPDGYAHVVEAPRPTFNPLTHRAVDAVVLHEGKYRQYWNVISLTPEQAAAELQRLQAELVDQAQAAVQALLDAKARERNYDGILSACTYATSSVPKFAAEAAACVAWRDAVWATCYQVMAEAQAGTRHIPTIEQLLQELPSLTWPEA